MKSVIIESCLEPTQHGIFICEAKLLAYISGENPLVREEIFGHGAGSSYEIARSNAYAGLAHKMKDRFLQ